MAVLHGRFAVQSRLHAALLGGVWVCRDLQDNRLVAVKQMDLNVAQQAVARNLHLDNPWTERRTLDALATLEHYDNIVQVYQQFQQGDSWFVVMEHCDGGDLWQKLERQPHQRFPEAQALQLFAQIANGVQVLHVNAIAHRDLSLENVLLSHNDDGSITPKICDFGLSTKTDHLCSDQVGKAYYMAPEVVAGAEYDAKAIDVWSLGIILFILLTGSPLASIASETEKEFTVLKTFGVQTLLRAWRMDDLVSPLTTDLLTKMLQVIPANRFTVQEVVAHPALNMP
ncbi:hypothetical protein DVH05_020406 [Phytophthora capsici]|nr:hypothetical protein DVH05_020406 [Phytophthora capsici]|eukprot:jgi/Phyca11/541166/estExt2_Genewise1Plus.C_PHYCAscaffold_60248